MLTPSSPPPHLEPQYSHEYKLPRQFDPLESTTPPRDREDSQVNAEATTTTPVNEQDSQGSSPNSVPLQDAQSNDRLTDARKILEWSNNNQDALDGLCQAINKNRENRRKSDLPSQEFVASSDGPPPTPSPSVRPGYELVPRPKYDLLLLNTPSDNNSDIAKQLRECTNNSSSAESEQTTETKI